LTSGRRFLNSARSFLACPVAKTGANRQLIFHSAVNTRQKLQKKKRSGLEKRLSATNKNPSFTNLRSKIPVNNLPDYQQNSSAIFTDCIRQS